MRIALQIAGIALLVAGCGTGMESSAGNRLKLINVPPSQLKTEIVGASAQQKEILLASLSGVGDRRVQTITIEKAESDWGVPDGVGVRFTPRPDAADDMRMSWEADLVGDAFAERSRELGLPPVAYVAIPGEESAIGSDSEDSPRRSEESVTAFAQRITAEADRAGATVSDIEILRPLRYAIAVILQVPDPAAFLDRRAPAFFQQLGEPPRDYDLRIVDSNGGRVSENWNAGSGGAVWIRKDLDGCNPYLVSRPVSYKPPPCPDQSLSRQ
jgi:hypothetical protein